MMMESASVNILNRRNISQNNSSSEVHHIMAKLTRNKEKHTQSGKKTPQHILNQGALEGGRNHFKRVVSPEIEKLTGQLRGKMTPAPSSQLSRSDPGYGTPQARRIRRREKLKGCGAFM